MAQLAKSGLLPASVNKVFLEHSLAHSFIISCCFLTSKTERSSWDEDLVAY